LKYLNIHKEELRRKRRKLAKKLGLCANECGRPVIVGKTRCEVCNEKLKDNYQRHKDERRKYNKLRYSNEKNRIWKYARTYNMSVEDYENMLMSQNGVCAICNNKTEKVLCVDHDHSDNDRVRGLLCHNCNKLLGFAKDNIYVLSKAIEYLGC
jgi:hypothetical protein